MDNKGIGAIFCLISAILAGARYISAAVFMSGVTSWSRSLFQQGLEYVGPTLKTASVVALIAGVCFLGYGIFGDIRRRGR